MDGIGTKTLRQLREAIALCADFRRRNDRGRATTFIDLMDELIRRLPLEATKGTASVRRDLRILEDQRKRAAVWLRARQDGSSATFQYFDTSSPHDESQRPNDRAYS